MVGGSPAESQGAGRFEMDRVLGNGTGIVAFDKRTGEVKYKITDELASLLDAATGPRRRPSLVLRARSGRTGRV